MPDPIIVDYAEDAIKAVGKMSKANGFHYDYAEDIREGVAGWELEGDWERPGIFFEWIGEQPQDANTGAETAAGRHRRYWVGAFSVSVRSTERGVTHWQKAQRVVADFHKALLAVDSTLGLNRNRGSGRTTTYDPGAVEWVPVTEGRLTKGGDVRFPFVIRYDHLTADMGSTG